MKGLFKRGSRLVLVMVVVSLLMAPLAVQAGEEDIPRIFSVGPSNPVVYSIN